jgi:ABC-type amino acid transport substrate-binding protein
MDLASGQVETRAIDPDRATPLPISPGQSRVDAIKQRGSLRVGYFHDALPFVYRNELGNVVGLEVDLVSLLAAELDVAVEFVLLEKADIADKLAENRIDIAIGGLLVTPHRALELRFSTPYLYSTLSLVTRDHRRNEINSREKLRQRTNLRIATLDLSYYRGFIERYLPNADLVTVDSPRQFFRAEPGQYDALLYTAEGGSAWTLVYPEFSVVVPKPETVGAPIAIALPLDAPRFGAFVDAWLMLQREGTVLDRLRDYWILGLGSEGREPRWSVIRNVLGWVE